MRKAKRDWLSGVLRLIGGSISAGAALVSILSYTTSHPLGAAAIAAAATARVHRLALAPAPDTITALGDSIQLAALATDESGSAVPGISPAWSSSDSAVLMVDRAGTAVARAPGAAVITVRAGPLEARTRIVVLQRACALLPTDSLLPVAEGGTALPPMRVVDGRGHPIEDARPVWSSGDPAVATVDSTGSVSGVSPGRTMLTGTLGALQATVAVQVIPVPGSITVLGGEGQRAAASTPLPNQAVAQIVSRSGRPVAGAVARFEAAAGGTATPAVDTSDAQGMVGAVWTLGETPGRQRLTIAVDGVSAAPALTAEADPVPANARVALLADQLAGVAGDTLDEPIAIRLTDSLGLALADVPVAWSAGEGGALTALAPRTDSLGEARAVWRLGPRAGRQRARIQAGNARTLPAVVAAAVARSGPAAAVVVRSGGGQAGTVGKPLSAPVVVAAVDRRGNPVPGVALVRAAGPGAAFDDTVSTDSTGRTRLRWTLGKEAGPQRLVIRLRDDTASAEITARARAGAPFALIFVAPPATSSGRVALPLLLQLADAFGNPVPGRTVVLKSSSGKASPARVRTDEKGRAQLRWTPAGATGKVSLAAAVIGTRVTARLTLPRH